MKIATRARLTHTTLVASFLTGCVATPTLQNSYPFDQHPGVSVEVWWQYDPYGYAYTVTNLVNRSGKDKCAWTSQQPSRLLRAGETWQVGQVQSPGGVGVSNVQPSDPACINARPR
jgi:hypothetical protein